MRIYIYLQCLISSLYDDIIFWRNDHFTSLLCLDGDNWMKCSVIVDSIVSVGMRDDRLREIIFDRRSVSEIPSKGNYLITRIVEYACRSIESDIKWISTHARWSHDNLAYDIFSIDLDRDHYF